MSTYYIRYCQEHGEYEADIDGDQECEQCVKEGKTSMQVLQREAAQLRADNEALVDALRPFAALLQDHQKGMLPEHPIFGINDVTILKKHLLDAAQALSAYGAKGAK